MNILLGLTLALLPQQPSADSILPIAVLRADADRDHVSDHVGQWVTVAGRATVGTGSLHPERLFVAVQDDSAGVLLFDWAIRAQIRPGDSVVVRGVVKEYNGLLELVEPRYRVVAGPPRSPRPREIRVDDARRERYEGMLVRVDGRVIARGVNDGGDYLLISDPEQPDASLSVFLANASAAAEAGWPERLGIGDRIRVTGVLGQFDPRPPATRSYQIYPRSGRDIEPIGLTRRARARAAAGAVLLLAWALVTLLVLRARLRSRTNELSTALEELRSSEARLRLFAEQVPALVWTTDRELRLTRAAGRGLATVGLKATDVLGRSLYDVLRTDDPESLPIAQHRRALAGESVGYETEWRGRAFEVVVEPFRAADGSVTGTISLALDVTERQQAAQEVARQRAFYEQVLEHVDTDIAVFDTECRYEYVNPKAVRDPDVRAWMIGRDDVDYCRERGKDPELGRDRQQWMRLAIATGRTTSFEEQFVTPAGETRHFVRKFCPVLDADGRVVRLIGYGFDVTERKQAEAALRRTEERLRHAQKMEAVGRLAGGIAHDFNNLLTVVKGHVQLLLADRAAARPMLEDLTEIDRAADRAAQLTRQLLAFSRKQMLQPELLDLNHLVRETIRLLRRLIGEDVEIEAALEPDIGPVLADPGQLEQVLVNLAVNARDAMPGGGLLRIATSTVRLDSRDPPPGVELEPGAEIQPGPYVVCTVSDNGLGMDPSTLARIFEPFFTTKGVGKGTGLGLPMVYGSIRQSGGYVGVESQPGLGTTFRIYLPLAEGSRPAAARPSAPRPSGGAEVVLVVEDEAAVRTVICEALRRHGYTVLEAEDGLGALEFAETRLQQIDLLVTDVVMPGMNGRELAERLVGVRPDLPVLFISGYTDDQLGHYGILDANVTMITKPFTPDEVAARVREVLDVRGPRQQA